MLTLGINISNIFSTKNIEDRYYLAYLFIGILDVIVLVLFLYVFKTRPFEEDVEKNDE
jgi:hypothetical protein